MGVDGLMAGLVAVILSMYLVIGLFGNLLTIIALVKCPRIRNVTAAFIISLCAADCLFCVLVLPFEASRFYAGHWVWGQGLICTILPFIRYWNVAVSLLSIAMITVNRYILIAHFNLHKRIYRRMQVGLMIAFCWVFPIAMLLPTLTGQWGRFGFDEKLQTCSIIDENGKSPKKLLFALGFCVPAVIIIICYSLIFTVIRRFASFILMSEKRMQTHKDNEANENGPSKLQGNNNNEREERRKKNEWRITKMILTIFITFVLSYLPITVVKFIDPEANYSVLHMWGYVFIYVSCCVNPLIYVIMNRQYRQAYKTVLLCKSAGLSFQTEAEMKNMEGANPSVNDARRLSSPPTNCLQLPDNDGKETPKLTSLHLIPNK